MIAIADKINVDMGRLPMLILEHTIDPYDADASLAYARTPETPRSHVTALATQPEFFDKQHRIGEMGSSKRFLTVMLPGQTTAARAEKIKMLW